MLAAAVVYPLFWGGYKPARMLLIGVSVVGVAMSIAAGGAPGIVGVIFVSSAIRSPRNKLFFEIELTEDELMAGWRAANDNHIALRGRGLAIVGLLSCLAWIGIASIAFGTLAVGVFAAVLGGIGLARVDPNASPPVAQRGAALFGIVGGVISVVGAAGFLLVSRFMH